MADFLTAVSTKKVTEVRDSIQEIRNLKVQDEASVDSPKAALDVLKTQPSHGALVRTLRYLTKGEVNFFLPDPMIASIAHQLVNDTIPSYWRTLRNDSKDLKLLIKILRNPIGIGHIITRIRNLIVDSQKRKEPNQVRNTSEHIVDLIEAVDQILSQEDTSKSILQGILAQGKNETQKKLIWREFLSQVASGRLLALIAEAEDVLKKDDTIRETSWIADGSQYAGWLARNFVVMITSDSMNSDAGFSSATIELSSKLLGLGYTDKAVDAMISELIKSDRVQMFTNALLTMKGFEQRKYFDAILCFVAKTYFSFENVVKDDKAISLSSTIAGSASLLKHVMKDSEMLQDHAVKILTQSTIPLLDDSLGARRSIIAVVAREEEKLHNLLENCIKLFGESVYIKHTPIIQQEALAQTLALCSGYVHRTQPMFLTMMAKSSYHVNSMSNRIGAPSARARFLGIAIGIAISKMVDKPELQLKFELDGSEADEAGWYQRLTEVDDKIGDLAILKQLEKSYAAPKMPKNKSGSTKKPETPPTATGNRRPRVIEVVSESEDEDADLMVYEKPDSDPEDDTDDPTAINRKRPTAPVYIRDLIAGLRDQENYDRHELAVATAASLIRRKTNFGTEVTDHLEELASILTGLHNNSELENFTSQRQQALIAVLLARPAQMAQWFARSFFSGDYSLTQRIAILTTLGLGARELASMKDSLTEDLVPAKPSFPSKQLPPHLHMMYTEDNAPIVTRISSHMAREMLTPLASKAADQLSGPNVLKVRTFSSRMEVEKRRQKPIPNALAQIVADNFFFPLTGRWWLQIRANNDSIYTSTHLLPTFLQTLSILLNASGPNTLALPQMTREYWDLLLSVRGLASNDKNILNAVLFGFLMLLETNENKERLATEQGKELLETQGWVKMVFDGLGAGSEEDERVRMLAAGVVVKCQEVVDKYQRLMAGDLMHYQ